MKNLSQTGRITKTPKSKTYTLVQSVNPGAVTGRKRKLSVGGTSADGPETKKHKPTPKVIDVDNANQSINPIGTPVKDTTVGGEEAARTVLPSGNCGRYMSLKSSNSAFVVEFTASMNLKIRRRALVVGNTKYDGKIRQPLPTAVNEVKKVTDKLLKLGFTVTVVVNQPAHVVNQELASFFVPKNSESINMFYYVGHGEEATSASGSLFGLCCVDNRVSWMPTMPKRQAGSSIMIIDLRRGSGAVAGPNMSWISPILQQRGYFLQISCSNASPTQEGETGEGIFAKHLIQHLNEDLALNLMFQRVRTSVAEEIDQKGLAAPVPSEFSTLYGQPLNLSQLDYDM